MIQLLTNSRIGSFLTCPRKHYIAYELGIRPEESSKALRVGSAFHLAMDYIAKDKDPTEAIEIETMDPYEQALVAGMITAYKYANPELKIIASELPFEVPLRGPSGRPSRIWKLAGVIDGIVQLSDGRTALLERKTTTRDFTPGSDYWINLRTDRQISLYTIAARELGIDINTILYDVIRRPLTKPRFATPPKKRKYRKKDGALFAGQREEDETPEEYAERITGLMLADHYKHFAQIEIARLADDLVLTREELWWQQRAIRSHQRDGTWYRNTGSCMAPYRCPYLTICGEELEVDTPPGFVRIEDVHPEIPKENV